MAHFGKLREDERLFALLLDGCEEIQEHLHLAGFEFAGLLGCGAVVYSFVEGGVVVAYLREGKNHRLVCAFALEACLSVVCFFAERLLHFKLLHKVLKRFLVKGCL